MPTCRWPVGLGAKRTLMGGPRGPGLGRRGRLGADKQRHRVAGHRLAPADAVDALVGLALDADPRHVDAERCRELGAHRVEVRQQLRPLGDDRHVDVADAEARRARRGPPPAQEPGCRRPSTRRRCRERAGRCPPAPRRRAPRRSAHGRRCRHRNGRRDRGRTARRRRPAPAGGPAPAGADRSRYRRAFASRAAPGTGSTLKSSAVVIFTFAILPPRVRRLRRRAPPGRLRRWRRRPRRRERPGEHGALERLRCLHEVDPVAGQGPIDPRPPRHG